MRSKHRITLTLCSFQSAALQELRRRGFLLMRLKMAACGPLEFHMMQFNKVAGAGAFQDFLLLSGSHPVE